MQILAQPVCSSRHAISSSCSWSCTQPPLGGPSCAAGTMACTDPLMPCCLPVLRPFDLPPRGTSNIVFSNGLLDPWSVFGVQADVSDSVVAVIIPDGGHHVDVMYSRPDDSQDLKAARHTIMQHVKRWVQPAPAPSAAAGGAMAVV